MVNYRFFGITTSSIELHEITLAWFVLSLAFAILFTNQFVFSFAFISAFIFASATIGVSFLLHELAHKVVAQRYGCFAEFRAFREMLLISVLFSFTGFVFAAPGAVIISGYVNRIANGKIASAGPLVNLVLALFFLVVGLLSGKGILQPLFHYGTYINALLVIFNLLPFGLFDGAKVFVWDRRMWGTMMFGGVLLLFFSKFV